MYKEKKPLTVVLIGVINKNTILLAKRKREPYVGYYSILGGRQTFGEEIRDIVKREVMEETGYKVKDEIHIKGTYSEILKDKDGKVRDHFLFVVCKAVLDESVKRKEDVENTDVEKFRWFDFPIKKQGEVKGVVIEVGGLAPIEAEHLQLHLKEIVDWEVEVKQKRGIVECECGFKGEPEIITKGHDFVLFKCPWCGDVPKIIE